MMERRSEVAEDAEAENNSKKEEGNMDETPLDAEKGLPKVIPSENAEAEKDPSQGDEALDAEKGLPTVIPTENAEAERDPSQGEEAEEGKRREASKSKSKSKCSKLQSLIFGSLQRFFMAQVRNKSIIFSKSFPTLIVNNPLFIQGKVVGRYPLLFLILPLIVTGLCCSGFAMSVTSLTII